MKRQPNQKLLRYELQRHTYRTGDVIAVHGTDLISRLIRMITGSSISHVAMVYIQAGRVWVIESTTLGTSGIKGVQMHLASQWLDAKNGEATLYRLDPVFDLTHEWPGALTWLLGTRGRPYSYWQAFASILPNWVPYNPSRHFCSELIAETYIRANVLTREDINPQKTTPEDLVILDVFTPDRWRLK